MPRKGKAKEELLLLFLEEKKQINEGTWDLRVVKTVQNLEGPRVQVTSTANNQSSCST